MVNHSERIRTRDFFDFFKRVYVIFLCDITPRFLNDKIFPEPEVRIVLFV